tara:strand:- start:187 stop:984 length:798 start_codon:yes stop_codon:yes gene_type:complete
MIGKKFLSSFLINETFSGENESNEEYDYFFDLGCLKQDGFSEISYKLSSKNCANLIDIIDNHYLTKSFNYEACDVRLWSDGSINSPKIISDLMQDENIKVIATRLLKTEMFVSLALLNKVYPNGKNKGSGGGWHRDGFRDGLKIIFYLNTVSLNDGPLAIINNSHQRSHMLDLFYNHSISPFTGNNRSKFFDEKLDYLVKSQKINKSNLTTELPGKGFIFNTRCLHRGLPMINKFSHRYALTLYLEPVNNPIVKKRRIKNNKINL